VYLVEGAMVAYAEVHIALGNVTQGRSMTLHENSTAGYADSLNFSLPKLVFKILEIQN
jgi:hypothetical protein